MSSTRKPAIRDFASLKRAWIEGGSRNDNELPQARAVDQTPATAAAVNGKASLGTAVDLASPCGNSDSQQNTQLGIANASGLQQSLQQLPPPLEPGAAPKDASLELLTVQPASAHEHVFAYVDPGPDFVALEVRERALVADRLVLERDRALFEHELDELDAIKQREAAVAARENSLRQLQDQLARRTIELGDLETLRVDLTEAQSEADSSRAHSKRLEEALRGAHLELKKRFERAELLASDADRLTLRINRSEVSCRLLEGKHSDLKAQFSSVSDELEGVVQELESSRSRMDRLQLERDEGSQLLAALPELNIKTEALLRWLAQDATGDCVGLNGGARLGWSGVGSYDADAFDRLLRDLDIQQYAIPHPSISHIVVGRVGWSKEDLLAQILMREGQSLRVYSQEMLLAALITGRDPLDAEAVEVLEVLRQGHPALEFLSQSGLDWPSVSVADTSRIESLGRESLGVTESPLHALGYKVGETSLLTQRDRQQILGKAFEMQSLPWVESDAYMEKWGKARSHQRLWRIVYHLAMLLNGPVGRDWRKPQTQED